MTHVKHAAAPRLWTTNPSPDPSHRVNRISTLVTKGFTTTPGPALLWTARRSIPDGSPLVPAVVRSPSLALRPSTLLIVLLEGEKVGGPKPIDGGSPPLALGLGTDL